MTYNHIIDNACIAQAKQWEKASEKTIFCLEFLDLSAHVGNAMNWVEKLEDKFDELLATAPAN